MTRIYYCPACKTYTVGNTCLKCKQKTIIPDPPRFSPQDHYGSYRRTLKKQLKKNVKNPFLRKLIVKFYHYVSSEISPSSLYNIEMTQKINHTISRLNSLRTLIQNE